MTQPPLTATEILDLEQVAETRFRNVTNFCNMAGAVFGGQFLALGLRAAQKTTTDRSAHACNGYFLAPASADHPFDFEVTPTRDGSRFAARHVSCRQNGKPIFEMLCSFNRPSPGIAHEVAPLAVRPRPEELPTLVEYLENNPGRAGAATMLQKLLQHPIETRPVPPIEQFFGEAGNQEVSYWMRMPSAGAIRDTKTHASLMAFMSDWWIGSAPLLHHRGPSIKGSPLKIVTINHSMWFHAAARADDWMLYQVRSPWAGSGRAMVTGRLSDRTGKILATVIQELALIVPKATIEKSNRRT